MAASRISRSLSTHSGFEDLIRSGDLNLSLIVNGKTQPSSIGATR
jgi:hypothetical protein